MSDLHTDLDLDGAPKVTIIDDDVDLAVVCDEADTGSENILSTHPNRGHKRQRRRCNSSSSDTLKQYPNGTNERYSHFNDEDGSLSTVNDTA